MIVPVIMAGGSGQRFWPRSRAKLPKQFLKLTEDATMIQATVKRAAKLAGTSNTIIVTNKNYKEIVSEQLMEIPRENIIIEPIGRNTAACIGLAALKIEEKDPDAIMVILPSDHLIKDEAQFCDVLSLAARVAYGEDCIVTVGVTPTKAETGYGYIHFDNSNVSEWTYPVCKVRSFVEKPDMHTAKKYLESKNYLWNSGIFVVKVSAIREYIRVLMPKLHAALEKIKAAQGTSDEWRVLEYEYLRLESVSIDYGIMEKVDCIYTIPGSFGWNDIGSWGALEDVIQTDSDGNIMNGNILSTDTKNCIVQGSKKLIALLGLENMVVVDTEDVTLVCGKDRVQDIGMLLKQIRERNMYHYL